MKSTNVLLIFVSLAIVFAALWIGSNSFSETVYINKNGHHHHHHPHNLGPGGVLQPIHTHFI